MVGSIVYTPYRPCTDVYVFPFLPLQKQIDASFLASWAKEIHEYLTAARAEDAKDEPKQGEVKEGESKDG